jgi:dUTP pyrophosphatase
MHDPNNPSQVRLAVKRLHHRAKLPVRATVGAACWDIHALHDRNGDSLPVEFVGACTFGTGLAFEVPPGYVLLVFSRSGHGFKNDVRLANCVGVIDSDYRGELMVRLTADNEPFKVREGDRIAQAMLVELPAVELVEAETLSETERGAKGLGSTGRAEISDREWAAQPANLREGCTTHAPGFGDI